MCAAYTADSKHQKYFCAEIDNLPAKERRQKIDIYSLPFLMDIIL